MGLRCSHELRQFSSSSISPAFLPCVAASIHMPSSCSFPLFLRACRRTRTRCTKYCGANGGFSLMLRWCLLAAFSRGSEEGRDTGSESTAVYFRVRRTACGTIALICSTARHIDAARAERLLLSAVGVRDGVLAVDACFWLHLCALPWLIPAWCAWPKNKFV
ncbi:hypothetical protein TcG_11452 [Trypanosoma cruzi]|nr:hypothetical protein TcG_11452 [Trypanosoma cruzi]